MWLCIAFDFDRAQIFYFIYFFSLFLLFLQLLFNYKKIFQTIYNVQVHVYLALIVHLFAICDWIWNCFLFLLDRSSASTSINIIVHHMEFPQIHSDLSIFSNNYLFNLPFFYIHLMVLYFCPFRCYIGLVFRILWFPIFQSSENFNEDRLFASNQINSVLLIVCSTIGWIFIIFLLFLFHWVFFLMRAHKWMVNE